MIGAIAGDSDTLACITGGIAEAFYGEVPDAIRSEAEAFLTPELLWITEAFCRKYPTRIRRRRRIEN